MTITSLRKPKITYQQLLKEVRALPPRQQQKLRNELWQATGLHFIRPHILRRRFDVDNV